MEGGCGAKRVSSQPLGPGDEERNKSCAMGWVLEVYLCSPSQTLSVQCACDYVSRRTREEDQIKFMFTGLNETLVIGQIQEDSGNWCVCLHSVKANKRT